jgi:hypothetical protein
MEGEKRCEGTMDEKKGWTMDNDGTIPRTSKGSASWREEHAGADPRRGERNTQVLRRSSAGWEEKEKHNKGAHTGSGIGWRAKEIERGRGEARVRESIGQRRLRDGQR